jgi:hypothetical protein
MSEFCQAFGVGKAKVFDEIKGGAPADQEGRQDDADPSRRPQGMVRLPT